MPTYEYICTECETKIEVKASVKEKEKGLNVVCPKCGSKKTARIFGSAVFIGTSGMKGNPSSCGPNPIPGCCG
jgi:putative FmdB family regulatory protein